MTGLLTTAAVGFALLLVPALVVSMRREARRLYGKRRTSR